MECKYLDNVIAIQYQNFLKPCCAWKADEQWIKTHNLKTTDIVNWHHHEDLIRARTQLANNQWPTSCSECENMERQGRKDSIRLGGNKSYKDFATDDLVLEIWPGSVCNFACQTCSPLDSSRVIHFYRQANIPHLSVELAKTDFSDFNFLSAIKQRLKKIIILGGEPFYDPKCLDFFQWCKNNTNAELTIFTNGSIIVPEFLNSFTKKNKLVFSLDATGKPAEYIRFGTIWNKVWENFNLARNLANIEAQVNITTSVYNFYYFPDLIDMLIPNWPTMVSFGPAIEDMYSEQVIPLHLRSMFIDRLNLSQISLFKSNIEPDQKSNAINAIKSIVNNLRTLPYNHTLHSQFKTHVAGMDRVKKIKLSDYCPEISKILND
jgi:organic radical activating enzyme